MAEEQSKMRVRFISGATERTVSEQCRVKRAVTWLHQAEMKVPQA